MSKPGSTRPLSPHLSQYTFQLHMAMSILHRATGVVLAIGSILLVWWLLALASGPRAFETFQDMIVHPLGRLVLFGFTLALAHHLGGGIRHLLMDTGALYDLKANKIANITVVACTVIMTLLAWLAGYAAAGQL